jgi:hypothetical protein
MESRKREKRHREGVNGRWVCRSSSAWTCSAAKQIRATRACMRDDPATVTTGLDVPSGKSFHLARKTFLTIQRQSSPRSWMLFFHLARRGLMAQAQLATSWFDLFQRGDECGGVVGFRVLVLFS